MYIERKLRRKKIKRLLIIIIPILILIIGSSFAFFTFSKSHEAFILTTKGVSMQVEFKEGTNVINTTYAYPISDKFAKENLGKLGYVDFTVSGEISNEEYLYYELYLTEEDGNTLDSNYIKVYLTDDNDKEVVTPSIYNKLSSSTSDNKNGKILYNESITGIFEKNYRLYVWIDSTYTQNTEHQTFAFKVNLYAYDTTNDAVDVIKNQLVKYEVSSKEDFQGGLVAVNTDGELYNETEGAEEIREYRYSGSDVNNYVTFNNETWRIIGVFKDESGQEHVKIVMNDVLPSEKLPATYTINSINYIIGTGNNHGFWNNIADVDSYNNWNEAGIKYFLNTSSDESGTNQGYLSYINEDSLNMIKDMNYYLGNINSLLDNNRINSIPKETYKQERGNKICNDLTTCVAGTIWEGNPESWNGKIALMYPSDLGYSIMPFNWSTVEVGNYQNYNSDFWLGNNANHSISEMLLSPSAKNRSYVSNWHIGGYAYSYGVRNAHGVRPTLYLKTNVKITGGDGTQNNQYKLSY